MARQPITPQSATTTTDEILWTVAHVDGHSFPLAPGMLLLVRNDDVASKNATIPTPGTVDGLAIADRVVTVDADKIAPIGLRGNQAYAQDGGVAHVDLSAITNVFVAVLYVR